MKKLKLDKNDLALVPILIGIVLLMSILSDKFLRLGNMMQVFQQMSELGVLAIGATVVIMTAAIDVSVTAVSALTGIIVAYCFQSGIGFVGSVSIGLLSAMLAGLLNGTLVGILRINPILATLGTKSVFSGLALIICDGKAISVFPDAYCFIGQGYVGLIPFQLFILVAVVAVGYVLVNKTQWGRCLSVIGNSPLTAKYSGVKVELYTVLAYVFAALCSAIGGIIMSARVATARSDLGMTYQMQVIAAVLLGGTSFTGGRGKVFGSVIGVFIFALLSNGFNLAGASTFLQQLVNGAMLIIVLVVRTAMDKSKEKKLIRQTMGT